MAEPIHRGGTWWHEQEDGSWLRFDSATAVWVPDPGPPPPPSATDVDPGVVRRLAPRVTEESWEPPVGAYRPTDRWAQWTTGFLVAAVVLAAAAIVSDFFEVSLLSRIESRDLGSLAEARKEADANDDRQRVIAAFQLLVLLLAAVPWLLWFRVAYQNLPHLGVRELRFKPGWAVGGWFVPFLNLVRPKQITDDIWRASDPSLPPQAEPLWRAKGVHAVVHWWWAAWIASGVTGWLATGASEADSIDELRIASLFTTLSDLCIVVTGILAIQVVKGITSRQSARAAALAASGAGRAPDMGGTPYRGEFPILAERTYLISASLGPLSVRSRRLAEEHLDLWQRLGPEELWFDHGFPRLQKCREQFAALIGALPEEVAIVPSVSVGLSSIASCLDFTDRPKVVLSEMDFPTNHYVWRAQERRGAKLEVVGSPDGIRINEGDMVARVDEQTAIVNVNRVLFESSWIVDVGPVVEAARSTGAYVVVDDFHGSGVVPIDVHALGLDFLVSGALKWLCGGQGIAFLYCRRDLIPSLEPLVVGWFGTVDPFDFDRSRLRLRPDARRFETGTYALPQAWTASGGLEIILEVEVDAIRRRNQELTTAVIDHATAAGLDVLSPLDADRRGGLVRVRVPGGREGAERVLHALFERDVVVDQRGDALRISPHFFNDESDIDRCFEELRALL